MQPAKSRILYVEDHDDTRELIALVLEQENYDVVTATSIAGALTLAKKTSFDLFILDSLLVDGTGVDLCKHLRLLDDSTPILFCSAKAYETDKAEAFSSGAQSYLVKPVDLGLLCEVVAELITGHTGSVGRANGNGSMRKVGRANI
jgi:DNA-binding response OmpR family regulator